MRTLLTMLLVGQLAVGVVVRTYQQVCSTQLPDGKTGFVVALVEGGNVVMTWPLLLPGEKIAACTALVPLSRSGS